MRRDIEELRPTSIETAIELAGILANTVPTIGGLLSGIVMNASSSRRWGRLLVFLESIESRLHGLESLSDDQEEIVVEIVERVVRGRSEEKTSCYRNILLNGLASQEFNYDKTLEMVKLVERLAVNHIKVLHVVRDPVVAKAELGGLAHVERPAKLLLGLPVNQAGLFLVSPYFPDWPAGQLSRIWEELCDANILDRISPSMDIRPKHDVISVNLVATVLSQYITQYGHDFIRHVLMPETGGQ